MLQYRELKKEVIIIPPKAKFTKKDIVNAGLEIVRENGIDALTARNLGEKLGSSPRPIFTSFNSMEEVLEEVEASAKKLYAEYVAEGLKEDLAFRGVGNQYILFAVKEPKLFQLLFMTELKEIPTLSQVLPVIDESYDKILESVQNGYNLDRESSERLYQHLWIYTHGIATLCATKMCRFTGEEIGRMMTEIFIGLLKNIKGDNQK